MHIFEFGILLVKKEWPVEIDLYLNMRLLDQKLGFPTKQNFLVLQDKGTYHYSVYAFTHYLVHSLFGWELGQLVFIAKKGV